MVWRLETHAQHQPAAAALASGNSPVIDSGAGAAASSPISSRHSSSDGGPRRTSGGGSSVPNAPPQQPEVSGHSARDEVAAWASYRLVCRRWNDHFRSHTWHCAFCAVGSRYGWSSDSLSPPPFGAGFPATHTVLKMKLCATTGANRWRCASMSPSATCSWTGWRRVRQPSAACALAQGSSAPSGCVRRHLPMVFRLQLSQLSLSPPFRQCLLEDRTGASARAAASRMAVSQHAMLTSHVY